MTAPGVCQGARAPRAMHRAERARGGGRLGTPAIGRFMWRFVVVVLSATWVHRPPRPTKEMRCR